MKIIIYCLVTIFLMGYFIYSLVLVYNSLIPFNIDVGIKAIISAVITTIWLLWLFFTTKKEGDII